ncbi:C-C chemokine receptor type 4-like [Oreochromis niloticus]|uniref:C-C chemokine receptor type 4-like n=1 Tax=Oreochromis niloticus TaxID=8128 RepID=UPI0009055219|nr:C-C chemokine receptor type 4-like [Oreochromis niloticus]
MVTYNISSPGFSPHPSWNTTSLVPAVVLSICFLLGFPGNIAVIIVKPNWENMSSLSQSLMLNLAVSDLLCLVTLPIWTYYFVRGWIFGLVFCKLITYFVYCSIYGSLLTVTLLSIQRYLQVVQLERTLPQWCCQSASCWDSLETSLSCFLVSCKLIMYFVYCSIFSSLLTVTALSVQRYLQAVYLERRLHEVKAWKLLVPLWLVVIILSTPGQRMAVVLTETLVGTVSLCAIVFSYISLYRKVNQAPFFNNPRTTRLITSIAVTFVVLWIPYRTVTVLGVAAIYSNDESLQKIFEDSWRILGSVTFINSAVNPLLYAFTSKRLGTWCQKVVQQLI